MKLIFAIFMALGVLLAPLSASADAKPDIAIIKAIVAEVKALATNEPNLSAEDRIKKALNKIRSQHPAVEDDVFVASAKEALVALVALGGTPPLLDSAIAKNISFALSQNMDKYLKDPSYQLAPAPDNYGAGSSG